MLSCSATVCLVEIPPVRKLSQYPLPLNIARPDVGKFVNNVDVTSIRGSNESTFLRRDRLVKISVHVPLDVSRGKMLLRGKKGEG